MDATIINVIIMIANVMMIIIIIITSTIVVLMCRGDGDFQGLHSITTDKRTSIVLFPCDLQVE